MNRKLNISTMVAIVTTLGFTSLAWGACNTATDGEFDTGAANVLDLSGQGNFDCTSINMTEITDALITPSVGPNESDAINWSTSVEADAVAVDPSSGNRCLYMYPDRAMSGQFLTPGSDKSVSDVVVCTDNRPGLVEAEEPPQLPTTTAGNGCTGDIVIDGISIFNDPTQEIAIFAENLEGDQVASCNQASTATAATLATSSASTSSQEYCEDRCVNFRDVGESEACLDSARDPAYAPGEFSLEECAPCDTALEVSKPPLHPVNVDANGDPLPMEFCWEKVNSVYQEGDLAGPSVGRTPGTMLKHSPVRQSDFQTTWYNKCRKSTITLNGIDYTTTTCK